MPPCLPERPFRADHPLQCKEQWVPGGSLPEFPWLGSHTTPVPWSVPAFLLGKTSVGTRVPVAGGPLALRGQGVECNGRNRRGRRPAPCRWLANQLFLQRTSGTVH